MKYSKTTLRELTAKYRSVLKKCALFNATLVMAMAVSLPTMADTPFTGELTGNVTGMTDIGGTIDSPNTVYFVTKGTTGTIGDGFTISGNKAASGVFQTSGSRSKLVVGKSTFTDNEAIYDGGAIASFGDLEINGTTFTGNVAQTENASDTMPMGGGAIALGAVSVTTIENATFTENESKYHGGAIATRVGAGYNNSSVKLDIIGDTTFTGNEALASGGAIYNGAYNDAAGNGSVNVTGATFTENNAVTGGAVYNSGEKDLNGSYGKMTITNGTFTGNTATNGAAIYNQGELTLVGGIFENNTAAEEGAVLVKGLTDGAEGDARAKLTIDGVKFVGNVSEGENAGEGGALTILRGADVEITGATVFEGNTAAVAGGAIATYATKASGYNTLKVTGTEETKILFKDNEGVGYGAVGLFSKADFTHVDFEGNSSTATEAQGSDGGGAVLVGSASKTTFNDVDFDGNTSAAQGGALATRISLNASGTRNDHSGATLDIENAEFEENVAATQGGAIFNTFYNDKAGSGSVNLTNVEFSENSATNGGAIYNDGNADYKGNYASMTITNGTFTGNVAENKGVTLLSKGASEYTGQGGAIFNASDMTIVGGSFEQNEAVEGGAIFVAGQTKDATGDARAKLVIDGVSFVGNKTTGNDVGGAISVANGADVEILNGTVFDGNKSEAGWAGALYTYAGNAAGTTYNTLKVTGGEGAEKRVVFKNNEAAGAGAVGVYATADFEKVTFEKNKATTGEAGALSLGSRSTVTLNDVVFSQNMAAKEGGAIATRYSTDGTVTNDHSMATLDIENAEFTGNISGTQGGAIFNTFYNDKAGSGSVNVATATFTGNEANEGGALYNDGNVDYAGNYASMTVTDGVFTSNKAKTFGGAVYNAENATLTLAGTSSFTGNTAAGVANDIYNDGTLNLSGTTTMDGGITGKGSLTVGSGATLDIGTASVVQGTVTFESGSALVADLLNTTSYGSLMADTIKATGADLKLTVGASGDYVVITGEGADTFNEATVIESSLFDLITAYDETAKTLTLTAKAKSGEDMAEAMGSSQQSGSIMSGLASGVNDTASQILVNIQNSGVTGGALDSALETLAPTTAPVTMSVASDVTGRISSMVGSQIGGAGTGRSGGDAEVDVDVWAKGLYSKAKQDASYSNAGFRGYTQGVAMGIDAVIDNTYTIGAGYAYAQTDVKAEGRKTEVDGHNFFVYGEYQPSEWYVRGMATYGMSEYKERKDVVGVRVDADYDVDVYGAEVMTGYDFASGITPSVGLRYLHITQDSYKDTAGQSVKTDDTDLLTAIAGVKYAYDMTVDNTVFTPEIHAGVTYDVISDNTEATVALGGAAYTAEGKRLPRFGVEAGVGIAMRVADCVELNVGYDVSVRRDYTAHTGTAKLEVTF